MTKPTPYRSYRRSERKSETPLFVAFIAIVFVVGFIFGIDKVSGGMVRGYARAGGGALSAAVSGAVSTVTGNGILSTRRALQEENTQLRDAMAMRDEEAARFKALEDENDALRAMARLAIDASGITAPVLSSFDSSPYGTFTIGTGKSSGIDEGSIVLTPGGFVLGSVTSVSARTATVEAFFAPGKKINMDVGDVAFEAEGRGGGNARGEVARDAAGKTGGTVIIP